MRAIRFDAQTKLLSVSGSRRELLRVVAALPLTGTLASLITDEAAEAGRRKRRKARRRHRPGKHEGKKTCIPEPDAATCTSTCGTVQNNCGQDVNCTNRCACYCTGYLPPRRGHGRLR